MLLFRQPCREPAAAVKHAAEQKQDGRIFDFAHRAGRHTCGHQQGATDLAYFEHGLSVHPRIVAPRSRTWQP